MHKHSFLDRTRGSAMLAVFVIATSMAVVLAGILSHSLTERRINTRHALRLVSKNASEAIVEYGFAQLRHKFEHQTNFPTDALAPGSSDALSMPEAELFGASLDYEESMIVGGIIPPHPEGLTLIDPNDPANEFDPLRGQMVYLRKIGLYAKATVNDPRGGPPIDSYVTQQLQVRDAPLFAHAIFYNLDLEVSPGPKMEIHGPVHTNGDLYVQGIDGVDFHYPVSTAKDMFYGWATNVKSAKGQGNESLQRGHVKFKNRKNQLVSMKIGDTYRDSNYHDWRIFAAERWNGYLLTQEHGVENYKPVAFPNYKPDDPDTHKYDPVNSGHALIEPPLSKMDPDYNAEIEAQKMSTKAGLYFTWDVETGDVTARSKSGRYYDISALEYTGAEGQDKEDYLYEINMDAMIDHRRGGKVHMLEFNVGKLEQLIETPTYDKANNHIGIHDEHDHTTLYSPAIQWNGIVYLETKTSSAKEKDKKHLHQSGIRLWGGKTGDEYDKEGIPSRGKDEGLSFATNNAVYIKGHFNADGVTHDTGTSKNSAVVPEEDEVPVAIFGDSVTILSNKWKDSVTSNKPDAKTMEVAAAIVSGLIPTNSNGNGKSSGGVHNFPRFLEDWTGQNLYIRGSLVCLYESEVDDSPWKINYYGAPGRRWGFSQLFLKGTFPPGTPLLRTYRRVDYTDMTKEEFAEALDDLPWNVTGGVSETPGEGTGEGS